MNQKVGSDKPVFSVLLFLLAMLHTACVRVYMYKRHRYCSCVSAYAWLTCGIYVLYYQCKMFRPFAVCRWWWWQWCCKWCARCTNFIAYDKLVGDRFIKPSWQIAWWKWVKARGTQLISTTQFHSFFPIQFDLIGNKTNLRAHERIRTHIGFLMCMQRYTHTTQNCTRYFRCLYFFFLL